jgi:hypothetical protein
MQKLNKMLRPKHRSPKRPKLNLLKRTRRIRSKKISKRRIKKMRRTMKILRRTLRRTLKKTLKKILKMMRMRTRIKTMMTANQLIVIFDKFERLICFFCLNIQK